MPTNSGTVGLAGGAGETAPGMRRLAAEQPAAEDPAPEQETVGKPAGDDRQPVPSADAQKAAAKEIKGIFAKEFSNATTSEQRLELAQMLYRQALETSQDPPNQFTLFKLTMESAQRAGRSTLALQAIEQTGKTFAIDTIKEKVDILIECGKASRDVQETQELLQNINKVVGESASDERFDAAVRLLQAAVTIAGKAKDPDTVRRAASRLKQLQDQQKLYDAAQKAAATLSVSPDDPDANLRRGRYLCLVKNDWAAGLPMLAKSSDSALAAVAKQDSIQPAEAARQAALGSDWFDYQTSAKGPMKDLSANRAAYWYALALPALTGLQKTQAEKRLESLQASTTGPIKIKLPERWISQNATYAVSSQEYPSLPPAPGFLNGTDQVYAMGFVPARAGEDLAFHTTQEKGAHVTIDLGKPMVVTRIAIINGGGIRSNRSAGIGVWLSSKPDQLGRQVWTAPSVEREWDIKIDEPMRARYVTIGFPEDVEQILHLARAKVFGHD